MSSQTEERIKTLEIALNNESQARDFYLHHIHRTQNSIEKMMFASIAADEDEHYKRILDLHKKLISDKKWPETIPIKVKGTEVRAVFKKMGEEVDKSMEKEFYQFLAGIEREHRLSLEDTYEYFRDPASWLRIKERHHLDGA